MATCLIIEIDATLDQYDAVRAGVGTPLGEGQLSHVAGESGGKLHVVDVWESRDHFDRFMAGELGEQMQAAGLAQPSITEFEVHSMETRD
jgi:hypothetical protein